MELVLRDLLEGSNVLLLAIGIIIGRKRLSEIHVLVNSRLTMALDEIVILKDTVASLKDAVKK